MRWTEFMRWKTIAGNYKVTKTPRTVQAYNYTINMESLITWFRRYELRFGINNLT